MAKNIAKNQINDINNPGEAISPAPAEVPESIAAPKEPVVDNTIADPIETPAQPVIPAAPTPEEIQAQADKAAINASASFHLSRIHARRVHGITQTVSSILEKTSRATNWTEAEVLAIWNRVENELEASGQ